MNDITPPQLTEGFYTGLGIEDEKLLGNLDMAINLFLGSASAKAEDKARDFERAVGVFSLSYVKMVQEIYRKKIDRLSPEQKFFVDFGAMDKRLMLPDDITASLAAETLLETTSDKYQIYYLSEWLDAVSRGQIVSTSEAAQAKSKSSDEEEREKILDKMKSIEEDLAELGKKETEEYEKLKCMFEKYSPTASNRLKVLYAVRKKTAELEIIVKEHNVRVADLEALGAREGSMGPGQGEGMNAKYSSFKEEFDTIVQVIKGCAVRGGLLKSTPALMDKWIAHEARLRINTKQTVADTLSRFEELDPTIFLDKKGRRKPPKILILPGVGAGMAWKDRIMLSLFPPPTIDPDPSFVRTLAGFRWYQATLSFNWKDLPGEIGSRYQLIYQDKTFNKLEKSFLDDYTAWMTKETLGYQTLNADVRKLFWKMIPFPKEKKAELAKRATVYGKLLAEDMSKGK